MCAINWATLLPLVTPFIAAGLAYWFGLRAYRNQKEFELIRARYLEEGVDRLGANFEYALGTIRHNYSRTLQVFKLLRDVHLMEAADLAQRSSYQLIDPAKIDLAAGYRLQALTRHPVFGRIHGFLFAFANSAENFFVNAAGAQVRLAEKGELKLEANEKAIQSILDRAKEFQQKSDRYYTAVYRLQDLGRILERQRLTFRTIDEFHKDADVIRICGELDKLFPKDEEDE